MHLVGIFFGKTQQELQVATTITWELQRMFPWLTLQKNDSAKFCAPVNILSGHLVFGTPLPKEWSKRVELCLSPQLHSKPPWNSEPPLPHQPSPPPFYL